jgi:hypothetical protein
MNWEVQTEALKGRATKRNSEFETVNGMVLAELTMQNPAWSYLTGCMLGQRNLISGYKFLEKSNCAWGMTIGYLDSAVAADSTATMTINEADLGDFNGVDAIVINNEFITGNASNGSFVPTVRGAEGTTSRTHGEKDLVYGIVADLSRSIVITSRKRVGGFFEQTISLSAVVDRGSYQFGYSGLVLDSLSFNFRTYDVIDTTMEFKGADSTNNLGLADALIYDANTIIDLEDIKICSEHVEEHFRQFYIEYNNALQSVYGYNGKAQKHFLRRASTFGTLTWTEESYDHVLQYEANTKKNFNVSMSEGNYRMIFPFNDVRINTNSYYMDGELLIQDSAPFYSFEDAVIMYQF